MSQPGRKYTNGSGYRYGFNGKEKDSEPKGEGNQYDYGMRVLDPRIGRFLSLDPLQKKYPELTPYQYASNRPIDGIDIDGLEWGTFTYKTIKDANGNTQIVITREQYCDDWMSSIGGNQLWLKPADAKSGEYGSQGIAFSSYADLRNAAVQFGTGAADFDANYKIANEQAWQNFKVIAVTDLALNAHAQVEGYVNHKIASKTNVATTTPTTGTDNQTTRANNGNPAAAETNAAATTSKSKPSPTLQQKRTASVASESIVRSRLMTQLKPDEILMDKPRFYIIKDGEETFTTPDFAIYNTKTNQFVSIPDAKNGGATLSTNQNILNTQGGEFRGSSRYRQAKPQSIAPGLVIPEKTTVPYK